MPRLTRGDFWNTASRGIGHRYLMGWYPGRLNESGTMQADQNGNILRADVPIITGQHSVTVQTIGSATFGLSNSCFVRFGIYRGDADGYPSTRVYQSAELTAPDGGGILTDTASTPLAPRSIYWITTLTNSAWYRYVQGTANHVGYLGVGSLSSGLTPHSTVVVSRAYGALPDPFPTAGTSLTAGAAGHLVVIFQ